MQKKTLLCIFIIATIFCSWLVGPWLAGALPTLCAAEQEFSSNVRVYDDHRTQVISPAIEIGSTFNEDRLKLTLHATQDVVTSASSEVQTFSSKGTITDLRQEYSVNFESQIPDGTLSLGVVKSDENDYNSITISGGGTREFFTKNTVVALGLAATDDVITATANAAFRKTKKAQNYTFSISQILSRKSLLQLIYDFRVESGYNASPYRRAKLVSGTDVLALDENHPLTRNRHAIGVKYNYYFTKMKLASAVSYRLYQDSWGVLSHTIEERLTKELTRKFETALSLRFYTQEKASFYQDYYRGDPGAFYTGNNTLATYSSYSVAIRPAYNLTDKTSVALKAEYFLQNFKDATDAGKLTDLSDDKKLNISALVLGAGLVTKF